MFGQKLQVKTMITYIHIRKSTKQYKITQVRYVNIFLITTFAHSF